MNSTVHPNDLLGTVGWFADLGWGDIQAPKPNDHYCKKLQSHLVSSPHSALSYFPLGFGDGDRDSSEDTHQCGPFLSYLVLLPIAFMVVLRTGH